MRNCYYETQSIMKLLQENKEFKSSKTAGAGRVAAIVANDEFFTFPLEFYEHLDLVFRFGDWDPRVCNSKFSASACSNVHWIPRGPSSKFMAALEKKGAPPVASQRRWLANFIGNIDASICITETEFDRANQHISKFNPARPLKTCYRTTARPAALSGMSKMAPAFKSRCFRPWGRWCSHGLVSLNH